MKFKFELINSAVLTGLTENMTAKGRRDGSEFGFPFTGLFGILNLVKSWGFLNDLNYVGHWQKSVLSVSSFRCISLTCPP